MKKLILISCSLLAILMLTGCYSYYYGTTFTQSNTVNKDEAHGESSSIVFLQLIGGGSGSVKEAVLDGQIDTIYRVEYEKSMILGGFLSIWTTHVYGSSSFRPQFSKRPKSISKNTNKASKPEKKEKANSNVKNITQKSEKKIVAQEKKEVKVQTEPAFTSQSIQVPSSLNDNTVQITNVPKSNCFYVLSHKSVRIYVDGKYLGTANQTYPPLKSGNHKIELRVEDYGIVEQSINATGVDSIAINASLIPLSTKASYIGGVKALNEFIVENLTVSNFRNSKGKVIVSFVVANNGQVKNIEITKSLNKSIDGSVIDMVSSMPKWEPATINGKKVNSYVSIPVAIQ